MAYWVCEAMKGGSKGKDKKTPMPGKGNKKGC